MGRRRWRRGADRAIVAAIAAAIVACLAACSPVPDPSIGCSEDSQCPGGVCVAGSCVATADVGPLDADAGVAAADGGGDGRQDAADAAAPLPCDATATCTAAAAGLGPCLRAACVDGLCGAAPLPADTTCLTAGRCPAQGHCQVGACVATGAPCDDGNPCTADQCAPAGCNHVAFGGGIACIDDGLPCTNDVCTKGACAHPVRQGRCLVDGVCGEDGAQVAGQCLRCDAATPGSWQIVTSGACDDGSACTQGDTCQAAGSCQGTTVACADENPCTSDDCAPASGCTHAAAAGACDDGDPCTVSSGCSDGACLALTKLACDDQNPCTMDTCTPWIGCVSTPLSGGCLADADPCTDDVCIGGKCVGVPSVSVCNIAGQCVPAGVTSDANPCLICAPNLQAGAWTVLESAGCDDGDACTGSDTCANGSCVGQPLTCADGNACTKDECAATTGCAFLAVPGPCDDGSACSTADACVLGACKGTTVGPADCIDGNPCTTDWCDDVIGCTHAPSVAPCDDGDPCTKQDFCNGGACLPGIIVCPCEFNSDCDDNNPCTIDSCSLGKGCVNQPVGDGTGCDDSDPCTTQDGCSGAICQGKAVSCDDSNPCTADACLTEVGCLHKALQGIPCDDGSLCTKLDVCIDGGCKGVPLVCDDGNECSIDACKPLTGKCFSVTAADGAPCVQDGIPCTLDVCAGGACSHSAIAPGFCQIGGACLSGGAAHPALPCLGCVPAALATGWSLLVGAPCDDNNACTVGTTCDVKGGCLGPPWDCDDQDPCTSDACDPQAIGKNPCKHGAVLGPCDDGNACTKGEVCGSQGCVGQAVSCDDNNPCTADQCAPSAGCWASNHPKGAPCADDGLACTSDICQAGSCEHPAVTGVCVIGGACVAAGGKASGEPCKVCDPAQSGTSWSLATGPSCDDGDACTGGDSCVAGGCVGDPAKGCDDANPCTSDACSGGTCNHAAIAGPCEDGNPCTLKDQCQAGACVAGGAAACVQPGSGCKASVCLASAGGCALVNACPAAHACVEDQCLTVNSKGQLGPRALEAPALPQPVQPTLAWQLGFAGELGGIPQLWVAAMDRPCVAGGTAASALVALRLAAATLPEPSVLKLPAPAGTGAVCAVQPQLRVHPTSYDAMLLSWAEATPAAGGCGLEAQGGALRWGLLGVGGGGVSAGAAASCVTEGPLPLPWPSAVVLQGAVAPQPGLAGLKGLVVRPTASGAAAWQGDVVTAWGGKGAALPAVAWPGMVEVPQPVRSTAVPWTSGHVVLTPMRFSDGSTAVAVVSAWSIDALGAAAATRVAVVAGAAIAGDVQFHAVEAALDGPQARIGAVISGIASQPGKKKAFLAFARLQPSQPLAAAPALVTSVDLAVGAERPIASFRVAHLPGSASFLVAWVPPTAEAVAMARVNPVGDATFQLVPLPSPGDGFAAEQPIAADVRANGLSPLVVDASHLRYSLVWQGQGRLWLRTALLPAP